MKTLKKLGWGLLILLILCIVFVILLPTQMDVEKSRKIDAPAIMVYNVLNNLSTYMDWDFRSNESEQISYTLSDPAIGVGAYFDWESTAFKKGRFTILESKQVSGIKYKLAFEGGEEGFGEFLLTPDKDQTQIVWSYNDNLSRPSNLFGFFYKRGIRKRLNQGLKRLNEFVLERKEKKIYGGLEVRTEVLPERHFIMKRQSVPANQIQQFYASNLGGLFSMVQSSGGIMDGMPCGLMFTKNLFEDPIDMAAAIPVTKALSIKNIQSFAIPRREAITVDFYGDYHDIYKAHQAIGNFMSDYKLLPDLPIIEEYITDPGQETDPSKWLTRVFYYFTD